MYGVGWRGWTLAFSAAVLAHAGVVVFVLQHEPEPEVRPDARRVAILLGQSNSAGRSPSAEVAGSPDAEMVAAVEGAAEVPPREAAPTPPETATAPLLEDAEVLMASEAAGHLPSREVTSIRPEPAAPPSPEDAVALAVIDAAGLPPVEEAAPTPSATATPPPPEDAVTLTALEADRRPPSEEATPTPPAAATSLPPEDAVALTAAEAAGLPPVEEATSTLPEPDTVPLLVPAPANTPARDSFAEPVLFVEAKTVVPARAPAEPVPAVEIVDSAEIALLSVGSWELAAEVPNIDEAADISPLRVVGQTPPVAATLPIPEAVVALAAIEAEWRPLPEEATPTPPDPAAPPSPEYAVALAAIEAAGRLPPLEAASILPGLASPPSPEDAEVATAVEAAGHTPVEEAISTPPETATTPSFEPAPFETRTDDSVLDPVRLVAAESAVPARAPAAAEPVEIVDSAELATPNVDSQELAAEVPGIDVAITVAPIQEAALTPPAPATSPPLEETAVLTAIETTGSPRLEVVASTPPVPAEIVGPTEEVTMRDATDSIASTSAPRSPEPQETQRTPGADEGAGALSGTANDGGGPAERAGYVARLKDWLLNRLTYPRVAQLHQQTGTALLYFTVDRNGRVQDYELRTSTGHELLDREVMALIQRAQPLPAMPEQISQDRLEMLVNIEFVLE